MNPTLLLRLSLCLLTLLGSTGAWLALADWPGWDFTQIIKSVEKRYGPLGPARARIDAWAALLQASGTLSEGEQLKRVNAFFNQQLRFVDDASNWHQIDYWATPIEALIKGAGDCEDYSLAKYFSLRRLGVSSEKLRITYVKALNYNQAHMVLAYYATPTSDPLVLDNLIPQIRPASQRRDLLPVYAFNAEGLFMPDGQRKSDSKKLSRWIDLLNKMKAEGFAIDEG